MAAVTERIITRVLQWGWEELTTDPQVLMVGI